MDLRLSGVGAHARVAPRLVASCVVALAALVALVAWLATEDRVRTVEQQGALAVDVATDFAQHLARQVGEIEKVTGLLGLACDRPDQALPLLNAAQAGLPQVAALTLLGRRGEVVGQAGRAEAAAQFAMPSAAILDAVAERSLVVGLPFTTAGADRPSIPLLLRWGGCGALVAVLDSTGFADAYRAFGLSDDDAIALVRDDGTLLLRLPDAWISPGSSLAAYPLFDNGGLGQDHGLVVDAAPDGGTRAMAFHRIDGVPAMVMASLRLEPALDQWRLRVWRDVAVGGAAAGVLIAFAVASHRAMTRRRRDRDVVRRQNALLMAQQRTSPDGILVCDVDGRVIDWNQRLTEMWDGLEHSLAERDSWHAFVVMQEQLVVPERFASDMARHLAKPNLPEMGTEVRLKNGRIFERYSSGLQDDTGVYRGRVWFYRDITQRKQAEQALAASEARFRAIVANAGIGIAECDPNDGTLLTVNPALAAMLGYGPDELRGRRWAALTHPEDFAGIGALNGDLVAGRIDSFDAAGRLLTKTGGVIWGDLVVTCVRGADGEVHKLIAMLQDVSDARHAEAGMRDGNARLEAILHNAPLGICIIEGARRMVRVNSALAEMFGRSVDELVGATTRILYDSDEEFDRVGRIAYPLVSEGPVSFGDVRLRRKDGAAFWSSLSGSLINPDDPGLGYVWIWEDVTARRATADSLALFKAIVDNARDPIQCFQVDDGLRQVIVNAAACAHFGLPEDELLELALPDWDPNYTWDEVWPLIAGLRKTRSTRYETVHVTRERGLVAVEISLSLMVFGGREYVIANIRDIGERNASEHALRISEQRFRDLTATAPGMVYQWYQRADGGAGFSYVSPGARDLLGVEPEDLTADARLFRIHPDDEPRWHAAVAEAVTTRTLCQFEGRCLREDGAVRWWKNLSQPQSDCRGGVLLNGIIIDITAEKTLRDEADGLRRRLDFVINTSPSIIYARRLDGDLATSYCSAGIRSLGYDPAEVMDSPLWLESHLHPLDRDRVVAGAADSVAESCLNQTYRLRHADGSWRWILDCSTLVRDDGGRAAELVGSMTDITERKRNEGLLELINWAQMAFIAEQEVASLLAELLRALIELTGSASGFVGETHYDEDGAQHMGIISYCLPEDGGLPRPVAEPYPVRLADYGPLFGAMIAADGQSITGEPALEAVYASLPAVHPPLHSFLGLAFEAGDEVVGMVGLANRDGGYDVAVAEFLRPLLVTFGAMIAAKRGDDARRAYECELAEAQAQLEEQATALARSNAELESFAYVASHDLRQPLRAVSSYVGLLERKLGRDLDDEAREYITFARDGARRMDRLIVDLLEYSRVGRRGPDTTPVSLRDAAREALMNLTIAIEDAAAVVELPPDLPTILGNHMELTRLFQNLIGNAVKYRAPDRAPQVVVTVRDAAAEWVVAIQDNGIGIAPEDFERVFGIFQRLHATGEYEGTGIGLAVCRKIVEQHGGRIWVEAPPGCGTTFLVALPKM